MTDHARHAQESPRTFARPDWLSGARFYEIYPQSFADSNGDGIGDIPGITGKLDYIAGLGCNALWINPCYDSPFKDAGYDVCDYTRVAARYGTNDDLVALFEAAHERGMHVLLDLVPGHTSEEHAWFRASGQAAPADRITDGENVSERYIWTDCWISGGDGLPFIGGEAGRDGTYILNFFKCQPALNYGFAHPKHAWQKPALGPDALATCEALLDVMRFWLSRGADGFRVDMADSLVKHDDGGKPFTIRTWQYLFSKIRPEFPEAAFVSEWGRPYESMQAGFDMDFYLDWRWDGNPNGYNMLLRNTDTPLTHKGDASYFNADSDTSIAPFLDQYLPQLRDAERAGGLFDLITCNHDTLRTGQRLTERERKVAYGMLMTMPGCPFLYYGDEIGMRYRPLPTKEGGYTRTGSRTPMQWEAGAANLGFSTADADELYLPVDPSPDAPTVSGEEARADSLLHWVRSVLTLRAVQPALDADAGFDVVAAPAEGRAFAYLRRPNGDGADGTDGAAHGEPARILFIAMNPSRADAQVAMPSGELAGDASVLLGLGEPSIDGGLLTLPPQSFAVIG
ncbi:alpha-amylase family glycosyl hydrolase [Bifidobacterium miconisargentati]|uniref:alpha-amylase family glycosyl hydrolase n=1 Tax=Bifidobacterium miconisargentati TaxID=2834437 RepID=UPI001BDD438B|nr:alpha-amylase family glycosyl hydrolase [Bifidobacterium miconisargentati]MBW3089908.1 alpha-amylase [Bifidobacterium miconisargentati]